MEEFWGKGGEGARDVTYNRVPWNIKYPESKNALLNAVYNVRG
jgi:hypothetical protein